MRNVFIGALLVSVSLCPFRTEVVAQSPFIFPPRTQLAETHEAWVVDVLKRMETIKPGMTRKDLLTVFRAEGGFWVTARRTFVSRDCLYFKVDVEFKAVGRPGPDQNGNTTLVEDERDVIVSISRPYVQLAMID